LYRLENIPVPNNCAVYCKEEFKNPTSSHYDRQTLALLRYLEGEAVEPRCISPGGLPLVETTTGSSGASFAWLCRVLGYEATVFIPQDMPAARINQIEAYGAKVEFSTAGAYIGGLVRAFRRFSSKNRDKYDLPDHSRDELAGPAAAGEMAMEIYDEVKRLAPGRRNGPLIDYFVVALGNGVSARGVTDVLEPKGTQIIGVEPYESPTVLRSQFPEKYRKLYGESFQFAPHHVYGTGPGDDPIEFVNISALKGRLTDVLPVREADWLAVHRKLLDTEAKHVGNSSAACVWAALEVAKTARPGSTICTVFYDAAWRYLPLI